LILLIVMGILAAFVPILLKRLGRERRQNQSAAQLRQSLQNIVHAMRVGVGFAQALEYAAKEGAEPLAGEWRRALQAVRLGQSMAEALDEVSLRVPIKEMKWFITAVQITQSTGGSLADVLDTLAATLQEQQTLREKVGALTAQGKVSGVLLGLLPFLMMGALEMVAPDLAKPLFITPTGQTVISGVVVSVVIGGLIIKKIVTVKVD
jgi:tight adherence protein B